MLFVCVYLSVYVSADDLANKLHVFDVRRIDGLNNSQMEPKSVLRMVRAGYKSIKRSNQTGGCVTKKRTEISRAREIHPR